MKTSQGLFAVGFSVKRVSLQCSCNPDSVAFPEYSDLPVLYKCNECRCTGCLDLFFWHLLLLKKAKIYIFFQMAQLIKHFLVTVCVFVSVNYSGYMQGYQMLAVAVIAFSIFSSAYQMIPPHSKEKTTKKISDPQMTK